MNLRNIVLFIIPFFIPTSLKAQTLTTDSLQVANTLKELLAICKEVDFTDSRVSLEGPFYKAAPLIVYRGEDKARAWKDFANYNMPDEKKGVDDICYRINSTVNQDSTNKIIKYFTETESEGTWRVLIISYTKKGTTKTSAFAFLKIGARWGLGDID